MVPKPEPITDLSDVIRCGECDHFQIVPQADGAMKPSCDALRYVTPSPKTFCSWATNECRRRAARAKTQANIEQGLENLREVVKSWR